MPGYRYTGKDMSPEGLARKMEADHTVLARNYPCPIEGDIVPVAGEVTDFLDVYWRDYHWPTFNVADSCITVGMVILVVYSLVERDEPPADDG